MPRQADKSLPAHSITGGVDSAFPETCSEILADAAAGNWGRFLKEYLRPCWREVVIACRVHKIPLPNADDLYQELMLRLLRDRGFSHRVKEAFARIHQDPHFRGNLPGRYLRYRDSFLRSARFRTYLKRVIQNLVLETVRNSRRDPKLLEARRLQELEACIEPSVCLSVDRPWIVGALAQAVEQIREISSTARTRGRRRLLQILYLADIESQSAESIGGRCGIDRTTVTGLLKEARGRLVAALQQVTGIREPAELKELLTMHVADLKPFIAEAYIGSK